MSTKINWDPATQQPRKGPRPGLRRIEPQKTARRRYHAYHSEANTEARRGVAHDARVFRRHTRHERRMARWAVIAKLLPEYLATKAEARAEKAKAKATAMEGNSASPILASDPRSAAEVVHE